MNKSKDQREILAEHRNSMLEEIRQLETKVSGLEMALSLLEEKREGRKEGVKDVLMEVLNEAGVEGLNAPAAIAAAKKRGILLHKATVSSLLSRLKKEGRLSYNGRAYRTINPRLAAHINGVEMHQ